MADGFTVDPGQVAQHGRQVDALAARCDQVVAAGHEVTPGGWDNAYGVVCQPFPIAVRPLVENFLGQLAQITGGVRHTASALGTAADQYRQGDDENRKRVADLGTLLEQAVPQPTGPGGPQGAP